MTPPEHDLRLPPAIVLGGGVNALSIARSLGAAGVRVFAINNPDSEIRYCRFSSWIRVPAGTGTLQEAWAAYLLGHASDHLRGAVLLAASDEGIEILAWHREALSKRFTLDLSDTAAQLCMLNKVSTYRAAQAAGVPTPKFWVCGSRDQVESLRDELVFPLLLKPRLSHEFAKVYSTKFAVVSTFEELLLAFDKVNSAGIETFLVERVPGPDDRLCSYYSYLDENGEALFKFTKRIIRRYPIGMGGGSYHITDDVPHIAEMSLRLFRHVGLRGIANAEFKLDQRDGRLKLIECNARFTAADCLLAASGIDLPLFVYRRLIGQPAPAPAAYRVGLRLWYPVEDYLAYRQLNKMGVMTFRQWLRGILHPQVLPMFRWQDPLPAFVSTAQIVTNFLSRRLRRLVDSFQRKTVTAPRPVEASTQQWDWPKHRPEIPEMTVEQDAGDRS